MYTSMDCSLDRNRREEMIREVAANRLAGRLRANRPERSSSSRFIRRLLAKREMRAENA